MIFNLILLIIAVCTETCANIKRLIKRILQTSTNNESFVMINIEITMRNPIRVLYASLLVAIRPELNRESSICAITFIRFILIYIITTRKQINRNNRVVIVTLRKHILRFLVYVHKGSTQRKLISNSISTII